MWINEAPHPALPIERRGSPQNAEGDTLPAVRQGEVVLD